MKKSKNDNDLTESINDENNQSDSLYKKEEMKYFNYNDEDIQEYGLAGEASADIRASRMPHSLPGHITSHTGANGVI